jgi:hypothetical protein
LYPFLQRNEPGIDLTSIDQDLKQKIVPATAVMMGVEWSKVHHLYGMKRALFLRHQAYLLSKPHVKGVGGKMVEENLWLFASPLDAIKASYKARAALLNYNQQQSNQVRLDMRYWILDI